MAKTLKAEDGMWLHDGNQFVKVITIADESQADGWMQVSQEFYDEHNPQPEPVEDPEKA